MRFGWDGQRVPPLGRVILLVCMVAVLAGCGTTETYVPNAVVILNPTPGRPSLYNGQLLQEGNFWTGPIPTAFPWPTGMPPYCCIPWPKPPYPPGSACIAQHKVKPGDTLSRIALKYHTSVQAIASTNNISNPHLIHVGQVLCIPSGWTKPTPDFTPPPPTPTPTPTPTPLSTLPQITPTPGFCGLQYRTRRGDTLAVVAARCGVSVSALEAANPHIRPPSINYPLYPNLILNIPLIR